MPLQRIENKALPTNKVQKKWTADARLRCVCGHSILCKVHSAGKGIGFLAFFDDEPASETCCERVKACPDCSRHLGLPTLILKNQPG
jgi:hypothetical protein